MRRVSVSQTRVKRVDVAFSLNPGGYSPAGTEGPLPLPPIAGGEERLGFARLITVGAFGARDETLLNAIIPMQRHQTCTDLGSAWLSGGRLDVSNRVAR